MCVASAIMINPFRAKLDLGRVESVEESVVELRGACEQILEKLRQKKREERRDGGFYP